MKLSRIYSNKPLIFKPIEFRDGLNVVLAEIRLPENQNKDTHNLGKSTLASLIDFCLLLGKKANSSCFLFQQQELFKDFIFFLEIKIPEGFVTIRRSVAAPSKIAIRMADVSNRNCLIHDEDEWDHFGLPFDRAKYLLDGILNLNVLRPWNFRKGLGYCLRSQGDFSDVFQLSKFKGKHIEWKPFVAHMLGLESTLVYRNYELLSEIEAEQRTEAIANAELGSLPKEFDQIQGLMQIRKQEADRLQTFIDAFDFSNADKEANAKVVDQIDSELASLNSERYYFSQSLRKIEIGLTQGKPSFSLQETTKLFSEMQVEFGASLKKSIEDLLRFNKDITSERKSYLLAEQLELRTQLSQIEDQLSIKNQERSKYLTFLTDSAVIEKYKTKSNELVLIKTDIELLERQSDAVKRLSGLRAKITTLQKERADIQLNIEKNIQEENLPDSRYSQIRLFFNEIVDTVLDQRALLSVRQNSEGNLEFKANLLSDVGVVTSQDKGYTYQKLLCIAFDAAIARTYSGQRYYHFLYHDGALESLDDRKKLNLIKLLRDYGKFGLQLIITAIDSDLPIDKSTGEVIKFESDEVIRLLHDEGDAGRLFNMAKW